MSRSLLFYGLALLLWACADSAGQGSRAGGDADSASGGVVSRLPAPADGPADPHTPVVLISIDTLRADRLPAWGYGGVETPAIDALAAEGLRFSHAYTHAPLTLPAHVSVLTGELPPVHGVRDNQGYRFDSRPFVYLPRLLSTQGYSTAAAVSAYVLREETGLADEGFDFYEDRIPAREGVALGGIARDGLATLDAVRPWLQNHASEPFFLFFHLFEPHTPYQPPEPFASRYGNTYEGEVAAADQVVGELIADLRKLGVYDRALIILFSDHGEGLGDHGEQEHGILLYREVLHVPLIIKLPGGERGGEVVQQPAQLVDILPTVLELLQLEAPGVERLPGTSLLRLPEQPRRLFAETMYPRLQFGWSELSSAIEGRNHYIHGPDPELYDLENDPAEKRNLLPRQRGLAAKLAAFLAEQQRDLEPPSAVDAETRQRLAALGYLGGGSGGGETIGERPDPKAQLPTLVDLRSGFEQARQGQHQQAVRSFRKVLVANPGLVQAWEYLGISLARLDRPEDALKAYGRALELSGGDPELTLGAARIHLELGNLEAAAAGLEAGQEAGFDDNELGRRLGLAWAENGQLGRAETVLRRAAEDGDARAMAALGLVLSETGQQVAAERELRKALTLDPQLAEAHEHLGLIALRRQQWSAAENSSQRAIALAPQRVQAWNNLGVALFQQGRGQDALEAWERAVELDPGQLDILYNLGTQAARLGRPDLARRALQQFLQRAPASRSQDRAQAQALLARLGRN